MSAPRVDTTAVPASYPAGAPVPTTEGAAAAAQAEAAAAAANPDAAAVWEKQKARNKFLLSSAAVNDADVIERDSFGILQEAGVYVDPNAVRQAEAQVAGDAKAQSKIKDLSRRMLEQPPAMEALKGAAEEASASMNIDIWQLLVLALKGAVRDQNAQLQDDLDQLQTLSKISEEMSKYSVVLQEAQRALDKAISDETDNSKKANTFIEWKDQRSYSPTALRSLNAEGGVTYKNLVTDGNYKLTSTGLNTKVQMFTQERDQLQKNIDKRTQKYQSDNEARGQTYTALSAVLKGLNEMIGSTTRAML